MRAFEAAKPDGRRVAWQEQLGAGRAEPLIAARRLPSGAGFLGIGAWVPGAENESLLDEALADFAGAPGLVVDLRGNTGGNAQMACAFRDRFLRDETRMGDVQFSEPGGRLGRRVAIRAEPAPPQQRWNGRVCFLTDPLTYSAAESTLLGLQGLAHVEVLGERSGGGSGQARSIPIFRDATLTVSSCLTFDRGGECVEGAGIPVDRPIPMGDDFDEWTGRLLAAAEASW
jgi:carboxyl-terminal processing protease